jgi:hypothetical protein
VDRAVSPLAELARLIGSGAFRTGPAVVVIVLP